MLGELGDSVVETPRDVGVLKLRLLRMTVDRLVSIVRLVEGKLVDSDGTDSEGSDRGVDGSAALVEESGNDDVGSSGVEKLRVTLVRLVEGSVVSIEMLPEGNSMEVVETDTDNDGTDTLGDVAGSDGMLVSRNADIDESDRDGRSVLRDIESPVKLVSINGVLIVGTLIVGTLIEVKLRSIDVDGKVCDGMLGDSDVEPMLVGSKMDVERLALREDSLGGGSPMLGRTVMLVVQLPV